ncbi:MAG: CheR family methyltransferase, partial [Pseudomonadales bacterium]
MTKKKTIKDTSKSNHKPTIVNNHFHIVSLGASAGGLKAFEEFFKGMPTNHMTGMAFVLVQHLAPDHKSMLAGLIRHYTSMEVFEVVDGMQVKPNCIYIIPPNYDMTIFNGCLQLLDPIAPHGHRLPIDLFLRSMAYEQRERSIAIILSGTGSDGTLGVRAIKAEGGMVMAQSPESAEFDDMPISAIDTGMVDYQLPPSEMATQLIAYINHLIEKRPTTTATHKWQNDTSLRNKIFALLRNQTSHDFSQYKPSTINRRIDRRLAVHQISNLKNYVKFLQHTPAEVDALFYDLLIGVTHFFRDKQAFNTLEKYIIPKLFSEVSEDKVIRIWSVGCSTGEEAYSIAILLREHMDKLKKDYKVQVFATDIDDRAIDFARVGIYPASIARDLSRERLDRFFIAESDSSAYRISKVIRNMLIFSEQDVIKDPPFSRLDLLCCRNLLIYFNTTLQTKLISLFHFALNPNAVLMLGTSEGIGKSNLLFSELSHKEKLFQRTDCFPSDLHSVIDSLGLNNSLKKIERQNKSLSLKKIPTRHLSLRELTERAIISEIAPASVLFKANGDILFLHGHSGSFLELIPGEAVVNNVMTMARSGLRHEIKQAMRTAVGDKKTVRHSDLKVNSNGDINRFNMTLCPIMVDANLSSDNYLYLMIMESLPAEEKPLTQPPNSPLKPEAVLRSNSALQLHIAGLQDELRSKDQHLEITQRELEVTNQELNSTNEEMLS